MTTTLRLHSKGSIQSDCLPIHHGVLYDGLHHVGKLGWVTEALGKRDSQCKLLPYWLREAVQEGRVKQTWLG